ncbi:MAG: glycosyltransferase family 39 protein [Rubritepida sp.]|nr:glycosyltransferase family 39 protein [Rubritepida sp.]
MLWLAFDLPDLYADEAQYWVWAQDLRFGYFTKPPLIAWLIAGTTALCGDGEGCIRLSSPLLHAGTALLLGAVAARLFGTAAALWTAAVYATLPAVSISSAIVSTDAGLLTAWAAALYALVRLRDGAGLAWWVVLGASLGAGFLAKYAMVGFLGGLTLTLMLDRAARDTLLRGPGPVCWRRTSCGTSATTSPPSGTWARTPTCAAAPPSTPARGLSSSAPSSACSGPSPSRPCCGCCRAAPPGPTLPRACSRCSARRWER